MVWVRFSGGSKDTAKHLRTKLRNSGLKVVAVTQLETLCELRGDHADGSWLRKLCGDYNQRAWEVPAPEHIATAPCGFMFTGAAALRYHESRCNSCRALAAIKRARGEGKEQPAEPAKVPAGGLPPTPRHFPCPKCGGMMSEGLPHICPRAGAVLGGTVEQLIQEIRAESDTALELAEALGRLADSLEQYRNTQQSMVALQAKLEASRADLVQLLAGNGPDSQKQQKRGE
jgi:hypothetical protein